MAEAYDGKLSRETVRSESSINDSYWRHVEQSGTLKIEIRNVPVELSVQIGELQKEASSLGAGQGDRSHGLKIGKATARS